MKKFISAVAAALLLLAGVAQVAGAETIDGDQVCATRLGERGLVFVVATNSDCYLPESMDKLFHAVWVKSTTADVRASKAQAVCGVYNDESRAAATVVAAHNGNPYVGTTVERLMCSRFKELSDTNAYWTYTNYNGGPDAADVLHDRAPVR